MSDDGNCLSMHQPYASLLVSSDSVAHKGDSFFPYSCPLQVCGIKRDEGRTWYSNVRGRLWIHAASKVPNDDEVREVKEFYKKYYNGEKKLPVYDALKPYICSFCYVKTLTRNFFT